ncbi:hypothetical protein I2494_17905 [Budviciaceae bacterium BWR-B9]|uniref:Uncharacterized protein n=1 Tax=Limnobaculum allomyrinae TaxID=2791986 RepID=A0ABS1IVD8_9GAMM|nr:MULTISPECIES: hypothetical protein [Limnobaculum]MBK5145557.1 hypothetical protein [Limnobaculum allomyrinae]MBV7693675.1 hypothetical protein [Limnobaculum sp. M2-1]
MNTQILIDTVKEYLEENQYHSSSKDINNILNTRNEVPLMILAMLVEKPLSDAMVNELREIIEHGGRVTGLWISDIARFHDNN